MELKAELLTDLGFMDANGLLILLGLRSGCSWCKAFCDGAALVWYHTGFPLAVEFLAGPS